MYTVNIFSLLVYKFACLENDIITISYCLSNNKLYSKIVIIVNCFCCAVHDPV